MPYTIVGDGICVCVCDDCGAYADKEENVVHHNSCNPGESKKWEEFFSEKRKRFQEVPNRHLFKMDERCGLGNADMLVERLKTLLTCRRK